GFTEALRMELERDGAGVSVTLIKPNSIDTPYPEHARNKMGKPAALPPVMCDPELGARAICFAAETPRRERLVGRVGAMTTGRGSLMPALTDKVIEQFMGEAAQTTYTPPPAESRD